MAEVQRYEREMRAMPMWLLQEYLVELGGYPIEDGRVMGNGWSARLKRMEDFQLGSLRVGQVRLEVEADPLVMQQLRPALEKKLLRAGG